MTKREERQLVGWVLTKALEVSYKSHHYTAGGEIFKQRDGGPEGLDTAVEACDLYMLRFDDKLLKRLRELGWTLDVYKRYVDDITVVRPPLNPGWHYSVEQRKMCWSQEEASKGEAADVRSMAAIVAVANTLDPNLQFTSDCPSQHQDGKLPILDIQVWVEDGKVRHTFYRKECASVQTILQASALSAGVKRATLFSEGMRRMSALDKWTTAEQRREVLEEFMDCIRVSGYNKEVRATILGGLLERSRQMEERQGYRNRSGREIKEAKGQQKLGLPNTWFLRGDVTSTLKVQATPGGQLAGRIREVLKGARAPDGGTIKVVEGTGQSLQAGLCCPDPAWSKECPYQQQCLVAEEASCWVRRANYKLECGECGAAYYGQTGHTLHKRCMEHMDALRTGNTGYSIAKHFQSQHPDWKWGTSQPFIMAPVGPTRRGNLERLV